MATTSRTAKADADVKTSAADFETQIEILRAEVAKLSRQLSSSGERSYVAARRAASDGVDHLRAQGEATLDGLRANARDIEQQVTTAVREKPVTALAIAAGIGFLFALLARR